MTPSASPNNSNTPSRERFIEAMSHVATSVSVVTTDGPAGKAGVTVSAMSSVSADGDYPTLLVCIHEASSVVPLIKNNDVFAVNLLRDRQAYISDAFAGRFKETLSDKFACCDWHSLATGAPCIANALINFDCQVSEISKVGTHHVILGEVVDMAINKSGPALVYANRSYAASRAISSPRAINPNDGAPTNELKVGCYHTFASTLIPPTLNEYFSKGDDATFSLLEGETTRLVSALDAGEVEIAILYDIDLPSHLTTYTLKSLNPYVILPQGHSLSERDTVCGQDLAANQMISIDEPSVGNHMEALVSGDPCGPSVIFRASSIEMMLAMVEQGLGFGLLLTSPDHRFEKLIAKPLHPTPRPVELVVAHIDRTSLSDQASKFMTLLEAHLQN